MIGRHRWVGFAAVAGVLLALGALGALILTSGGGARIAEPLSYEAAPAPGDRVLPGRSDADAISRSSNRTRARLPAVDPAWASRTGAVAGIPAKAMAAYGAAQLRMEKAQPGCNLSWNTLAGIGWIESQHGTLHDRVLRPDGTSSSPIIGPALNGRGFAAIRSTAESARWHGDRTWEHAVGPLQFLQSTWARWGSDGDGDGVADPMDLDDAAWTAARYLCADGKDLGTSSGWNAAVFSYNHDTTYVLNVASAANSYAQRTSG